MTTEIMQVLGFDAIIIRYEKGDAATWHHKILVTEDGPVADEYEEGVNEEPWMYVGSFVDGEMPRHIFITDGKPTD